MFILSKCGPKVVNLIADRKNISYGRKVSGTGRCRDGTTTPAAGSGNDIKRYGERFNIWKVSTNKGNGITSHPATFPEALARDHILSWSNEGDVVLDPFSGSGTTAKMAKYNGRRYVGIEINADYCEIARKRLAQQILWD